MNVNVVTFVPPSIGGLYDNERRVVGVYSTVAEADQACKQVAKEYEAHAVFAKREEHAVQGAVVELTPEDFALAQMAVDTIKEVSAQAVKYRDALDRDDFNDAGEELKRLCDLLTEYEQKACRTKWDHAKEPT